MALITSQWYKVFRTLLYATYFDVRDVDDRQVAPDRKQRLHYPSEHCPIISSVSCPAAVKNQSPPAASPVWPLSAPCVLTGRHEAESRLVSATHIRHEELARTLRTPLPPLACWCQTRAESRWPRGPIIKFSWHGHGNKRKGVNPLRFWSGVKIRRLNQKTSTWLCIIWRHWRRKSC